LGREGQLVSDALQTVEPFASDGASRVSRDRFSPANRRRLSAPGLRTFLAIADVWGLNEAQRLLVMGCPGRATYHRWARIAREHGDLTLDVDTLVRISAVLGIHQALGVLHADERAAVAWLRTLHRAIVFGGAPPLDLVTSGTQDGLLATRRSLDAARGGIYMEPVAEVDRGFAPYRDEDLHLSRATRTRRHRTPRTG
jgi:hypothetical protein